MPSTVTTARIETPDSAETEIVDADTLEEKGATEADERRALDAAVRPHRGSTFLSKELGALRRVVTVVSDGAVMDADELRKAAGYLGRPK